MRKKDNILDVHHNNMELRLMESILITAHGMWNGLKEMDPYFNGYGVESRDLRNALKEEVEKGKWNGDW